MANELQLLSICLQTPGCLPPLAWGGFGVGKTSRIWAMCDLLGWDCETLRPAERGEGAFGVVPVPVENGDLLKYPAPDWAARLAASDKPALVFLDEVSSTPPALQPAIMGLALDGIIAGRRLPPHVRRCAAANPVEQAAGGWELAAPLANRFVHLNWPSPRVDDWTGWLMGQNEQEAIPILDLEAWEREWPQARALGAAFIRSHPSALHEDANKVIGRTPPAFATPRTWESALRLLASCRALNRMDLYAPLAMGALGPSVALEGTGGKDGGAWLVWLRENDLPDPEMLLANPAIFAHDPKRPDRTFAALLAVAEASLATTNGKRLSEKARSDRWERGWQVLDMAFGQKAGKDVVLLPAKVMVDRQRRPKGEFGPYCRKVTQVLSEFLDLVHSFD